MNLADKYPKLFQNIQDKELEIRHLLSIDENYQDYDSDEFEFDYEDYNYIIYIAEPIQKAIGKEKMEELMVKLNNKKEFSNFLATDIDLYGVQTNLDENEIISLVLGVVEEIA